MPKVDVSYTSGKHAMKFGFSYNRYTKNQQLFAQRQGSNTFSEARPATPFMDMLLGLAGSYNEVQAAPIRHYVNQTPSVYAMDNWQVTPRLSLQLGLRYDALPHAWERDNQVANFDPGTLSVEPDPTWLANGSMDPDTVLDSRPSTDTPFYLNGIGQAGKNGYPPRLVNNDYKTLQPRVGFSEDLFGNGKTVLRGGFGTFYERMQGNDIYNAATDAPSSNNPGASNVYLTNPSTSWVYRTQQRPQPFFAQGITNLAQTYRAPAVAHVQPRRSATRLLSPSSWCSVCRQHCMAPEHPAPHQQLPAQHSDLGTTRCNARRPRATSTRRQRHPNNFSHNLANGIHLPYQFRASAESTSRRTPPTETTTVSRLVSVSRTSGA